ncbi:hypothetical protein RQP46_010457 [Phenoliferia psychrophenolica]
MLNAPQVVMATAQVLFQRFWFVTSMKHFGVRDIGLGALFLASKLEESPLRIRDLINSYAYLLALVASSSTSSPRDFKGSYIPMDYHATEFYDRKDALVIAEMQILKRLAFQTQTGLPYGHLVNYLQVLELAEDKDVVSRCWGYVNDLLQTPVPALYPQSTIAVAAIYLTARTSSPPLGLPLSPVPWWTLFDASEDDVLKISEAIASSAIYRPIAPSKQANGVKEVQLDEPYKYARFLPTFDSSEGFSSLCSLVRHAALKDPNPRSFLDTATSVDDLTPDLGTEIKGVQLHLLDARERSQLALLVAQRGVVAFRDQQEFIDKDPEWQLRDFGAFFGRLHVHPTSGQPREFPEFHLVYRDGQGTLNYETNERLTSSVGHSDVSYELQPPGLTALFLYDSPPSGGDTGYADLRAAYRHLSPSFRAYLETLSVVHSGVQQAELSRKGNRGGIVKREPVEHVHPLVRTHPVTGDKALFVNPQFSRRIVGLKVEESDAILNLLYAHIQSGADFQVRVRWQPGSVVLWDNRILAHTAIVDFKGGRRHGARITPQAERPFFKP